MTRATGIDLYDRDFYAWTADQAERLQRLGGDNRFDVAHVAEEIADLGKAEKRQLESHLRRILEHLLLLAAETAEEPARHWTHEVYNHAAEIRYVLRNSPSLAGKVDIARIWDDALADANRKLRAHDEPPLPMELTCPFHLDDLHPDRLDVGAAVDAVRAAIAGDGAADR